MTEFPDGLCCVTYSLINVNEPEKESCLFWGGNAALSLKEARKRAKKLQQNPYSVCGQYKIIVVRVEKIVCQKRTWDGLTGLLDFNTPKNCHAFGKGKIVPEYIDSFPFEKPGNHTVRSLQGWLWKIECYEPNLSIMYSDWFIAEEIEQFRVDAVLLSLHAQKTLSVIQKIGSFSPILLAA